MSRTARNRLLFVALIAAEGMLLVWIFWGRVA
jgi:hypothetical protein